MKQIRAQIEETTSDYDREKLQERLAKLVGGVAVIKVGAATETEMKEKKARVEDALNATRAAVEEGIVPGGGVAYIRTLPALDKLKLEGDEQVGVNIVKKALEEPLKMIADNAGMEGSIVVEKVKEKKGAFGFNARTDEYEDMIDGRRHRPDQGHPFRPAERGLRGIPHADDPVHDRRQARREESGMPPMPGGGGYPGMGEWICKPGHFASSNMTEKGLPFRQGAFLFPHPSLKLVSNVVVHRIKMRIDG